MYVLGTMYAFHTLNIINILVFFYDNDAINNIIIQIKPIVTECTRNEKNIFLPKPYL